MRCRNALTVRPTKNIKNGISTSDSMPDYQVSLKQHEGYVNVLERCDVKVTVLDGDERYPDSVFIEDTAVLMDELAVVCNLGTGSRRGEEIPVMNKLKEFYDEIERIRSPGTIEGGDVLKIENQFFVGLSGRTNQEGIEHFEYVVDRYGYGVTSVKMDEMLHLKTGIAYLGDDVLLAAGEMIGKSEFEAYEMIEVPEDEGYAANCVCLNGNVVFPEGYPKTVSLVEERGFNTLTVDVSEFKKLDGGISCLSLRF